MNRLYIVSGSVKILNNLDRNICDVAVFDDSQLFDYLVGAKLRGSNVKKVAMVKKAIYLFLEYWEDGERKIEVSFGDFRIATYPTDYIDKQVGLIELGERPVDPEREVYAAIEKLQKSMNYKSPNAAALYQELQDTIKKYPTIQIKEKA